MKALGEVQPKFGADNQELESLYINGIVHHSKEFKNVSDTLARLVEQTRNSERTPIMSVRHIYFDVNIFLDPRSGFVLLLLLRL